MLLPLLLAFQVRQDLLHPQVLVEEALLRRASRAVLLRFLLKGGFPGLLGEEVSSHLRPSLVVKDLPVSSLHPGDSDGIENTAPSLTEITEIKRDTTALWEFLAAE